MLIRLLKAEHTCGFKVFILPSEYPPGSHGVIVLHFTTLLYFVHFILPLAFIRSVSFVARGMIVEAKSRYLTN